MEFFEKVKINLPVMEKQLLNFVLLLYYLMFVNNVIASHKVIVKEHQQRLSMLLML
jgi:hypothetical protein